MRVLIADDDRGVADVLTQFVQRCGHQVVATVTGGGLAAIQAFARCEPDAVLLDIMMPRFNGLTACHAMLSRKPDAKVVFVSGSVEENDPFVTACGAVAYLQKPVTMEEIRHTLESIEMSVAAVA